MDWYGSNVLMTIPDTSAFEVAISVGEEYRGKLQPGNKALITVEAIPGLTIEGELKKIENLARNRVQWDQASPKVFDCVINPAKSDPRMLSGMTTRVEIVAEVIPDTLTVPLEAVYNEDGTPIVYVKTGEGTDRRVVKPGKSNDHQVEILEGLSEGELVDLTPSRSSAGGSPTPEEKKPQATPATPAAGPPQAAAN
jgi:multidrug efflux pump subunit AcrA (membrane-fusion protein)